MIVITVTRDRAVIAQYSFDEKNSKKVPAILWWDFIKEVTDSLKLNCYDYWQKVPPFKDQSTPRK